MAKIAEGRIREAMARGEFDDLPGRGARVRLDDLSRVPAELRLAYKVLKNSGLVPQEVELRREIYRLDASIASSIGEPGLAALRRRRVESELRLNLLMERRRRTRAVV
jgi:hypothetical protein